jgi:hypothetical protein
MFIYIQHGILIISQVPHMNIKNFGQIKMRDYFFQIQFVFSFLAKFSQIFTFENGLLHLLLKQR